jgi:hypothetical protein
MNAGTARTCAAGVILLLSLTAARVTFADDRSQFSSQRRLDLAATALTGPQQLDVKDDAWLDSRSRRQSADVKTTATASADCDDCSATATALHIVYLDRPSDATLDNVAVAWSLCTGCSSTTVSVQVVVLRKPQSVRANNHALAVNAACDGCQTAAAAYQLVVVGDRRDRLSRSDEEALREWVASQAAAMSAEPTPGAAGASTVALGPSPLDQLEALLADGLGGATTLERDSDLSAKSSQATPDPPETAPPSPTATPSPSATPSPTSEPATPPDPTPTGSTAASA